MRKSVGVLACVVLGCVRGEERSGGTRVSPTVDDDGGPVDAVCSAPWEPSFRQSKRAKETFVEFHADDPTVATATLEILGLGEVQLYPVGQKWGGASPVRVPRGALVILHAVSSSGERARTGAFAYLRDRVIGTDACASACAGGCESGTTCAAGSCRACVAEWLPEVRQGAGASEWRLAYRIRGDHVASARVEIVVPAGTLDVELERSLNQWVAYPGIRVRRGTQITLRAQSADGRQVETEIFAHLLDRAPAIDACANELQEVPDADLDVTYISRAPAYPRYEVEYDPPGYDPRLRAGTEDAKRWPDPGEVVTFTAHVANKGSSASAPFAGTWFVDDQQVRTVSAGPLAAAGQGTFTLEWPWQDGHHTVRFALLAADRASALADQFAQNNTLTIDTNAWTFAIRVWQSWYDYYDANVNVAGTLSFEDWLQFQAREMNRLFAETVYPFVPDGLDVRIAIDAIEVVPDAIPDPGGNHFDPPDLLRDGNWGFATWEGWESHSAAVLGQRDEVLMHEWGHQIGLFDVYQMDVQGEEVFIATPRESIRVAGTAQMPFIAFDVVHYNTITPDLMGGGIPFVFHEYTAYALLLQQNWMGRGVPKRRGYFGDYLFDIPAMNALMIRGADGEALPGVYVEVFQMQDSQIFDLPKFAGTTDAGGRFQFPSVTTPSYSLFWGGAEDGLPVQSPWSTIYSPLPNVVGTNAVFVVRVTRPDGADAYAFLELTAFNLAYFRGQTESAEYFVDVPL